MKSLLGVLIVGAGLFFIFPAQAKQSMQLASVSVGFSFGSGGYYDRGYRYRGYRHRGYGYRRGYYPRSSVSVGFVFSPGDRYLGCRAHYRGHYHTGQVVYGRDGYDYCAIRDKYGKYRLIGNYRRY